MVKCTDLKSKYGNKGEIRKRREPTKIPTFRAPFRNRFKRAESVKESWDSLIGVVVD